MTPGVQASIERGAAQMGIALPDGAAGRLARYLELLAKWNRAQNLTSVTAPGEMVSRHVLDSLAGLPWVRGERVLDIGSGAGLPGIPLAAARPGRRHVLLDSRRKRVQFLLYVAGVLGLDNVEVVESRVEKYRQEGKFDTLTARALAAPAEMVRLVLPHLRAGARLVAWQGNDPSRELEGLAAGVRFEAHAVTVPGIRAPRHILVAESSRG